MAEISIGGVVHQLPEMNFIAVERAWPYVEQAMETVHPIAGTNAAIAVIAATIMEAEGFDPKPWDIDPNEYEKDEADQVKRTWTKDANKVHSELINVLRRRLLAREIGTVKLTMFEILKDAGFELGDPESGEGQAVEEAASPSPETAPNISQSSLPLDAREAAGTA